MAETAYTIQYRSEYIPGFERRKSLLRESVTTEAQISGNQAVFLVVDSGGATTTTRGVNGRIQSRGDNNNQYTCTLTEQHDLVEKTGFNVFASQGDQRRVMQETSRAVINRKCDDQIITALSAATQTLGAAATASLRMFTRVKAVLGNNNASEGMITNVISPAAHAYLMESPQFTSVEYLDTKPLTGDQTAPVMFNWAGMRFIEHSGLSGIGTAAEIMYSYNKAAIGHAIDTRGMQVYAGYDEEQDYSWARNTFFAGAKLLQNTGIIKITHDGSAMAAV